MEGLEVTPHFWRGRRVFLTGHTGFKGSWLSLWLHSLGAEVTGYALEPPTNPSLFELARVAVGARSIIGDVRDLSPLKDAMASCSPEVVIHMAAQPLVRDSYQRPVETYATNVMGTVHVLEAVRSLHGVRAVINVTTDKCYANVGSSRGYREMDALGGTDPYSSSKACSEIVSSAYRASYFAQAEHGPALATARAGNVFGGGDWADDRLVPDIVRAFEHGRPACIRYPNAIRPWQHVFEPLRGYLILGERLFEEGLAYAEAWNFGPGDEDARSVQWVAGRMAELWGHGATWRLDGRRHPHEAAVLKLDVAKARSRLSWRPTLSLEAGLDLTVDWYRAKAAGKDMREYSLAQIDSYQSVAGA